ncbi:MAG TPA: hypothetical protein VHF26_20125 [Trebonia sp.]|nr:hypothetical protein [Trebonia sp.]
MFIAVSTACVSTSRSRPRLASARAGTVSLMATMSRNAWSTVIVCCPMRAAARRPQGSRITIGRGGAGGGGGS